MRVETSNIKELPELHRMGHTCVNLKGHLVFIWGGSNEDVAFLSQRNSHLWIYDTLTGYWRHRTCSGECPPYLSGSTSALMGQKMYVFGGHSTAQDNWLNSLYCLNLETFVWQDIGTHAKAEPTKPLRSDKLVSWSFRKKLYVFGGYGWSQTEHLLGLLDKQKDLQLTPDYRWPKFGWNNQLVEFDPEDNTWRWPKYSGKCPSARAAHSGALMDDKYYVFGGRDSRERLNDLYTFDMEKFQWNQIHVFSRDPMGSNVSRPVRHLLEPQRPEDQQQVDGNHSRRGHYHNHRHHHHHNHNHDRDHQDQHLVDPMVEMEDEEDELTTPSPSTPHMMDTDGQDSSAGVNELADEARAGNHDDAREDSTSVDNSGFEYPHPSHLLERWSLSSSLTGSGSSNLNDIICLHDNTQLVHQSSNESDESLIMITNDYHSPVVDSTNQYQLNEPMDNPPSSSSSSLLMSSTSASASSSTSSSSSPSSSTSSSSSSSSSPSTSRSLSSQDTAIQNTRDQQQQQQSPQSQTEMPRPMGRSFSSFTPISDEAILLYGGVSSQDENFHDCWLFHTKESRWSQVDLKINHPRLWHTASRTVNNEVFVFGGSCSDKIDEFCSDVLTISLDPKSLKRLALDTVARSVKMRSINNVKGLPTTLGKLIKLRKQAMALTMRRYQHRQPPPSAQS